MIGRKDTAEAKLPESYTVLLSQLRRLRALP
jgi:hypothetical protein